MVSPACPEIYEEEEQGSVNFRTDILPTLRELGPPDLVHLTKQQIKNAAKQVGVYHHVTGVDASSSASLAAYVNTLTYSLTEKHMKVTSGLYCCYNAFSRLDMRVQVTIPGSVESYCIDERGDKREATEELWLETYLCSVLRAYSYADDGGGDAVKKIAACRRFNPITNTEAEHRFLDAAERLFFSGPSLGSEPEVQVPNLVSNHLTSGLLNYVKTTGRYTSAINLFEKLRTKSPEIGSLLARVFISADEEVKAVNLLHEAIEELSMDYSLLDTQAHFCSLKGRNDMAVELASRAVVAAPSEFTTWARLAEIYIKLENWDLALLTLNCCPMFTFQDKDCPRVPGNDRMVLPVLAETVCDEIDDGATGPDMQQVPTNLRKLVASTFKGTFNIAYLLLTEITRKIGWDQLLKIRSQVFVMEEEYRNERQVTVIPKPKNASTLALNGSKTRLNGEAGEGAEDEHGGDSDSVTLRGEETAVSLPSHTVASETVHAGSDNDNKDPTHPSFTSLRHKRLCERWLDNLFMVLYEDLRAYTIWRSEQAEARERQKEYRKSPDEWEILGELAKRLHHEQEAVEAFQNCLAERFSPKAMCGVMEAFKRDKDIKRAAGALIRLVCWQYRWYSEFSPYLMRTVRTLIEDEGALKIRSMIDASTLPKHVLDLTHQYAAVCSAFHSSGSDT